MVVKKSNKKITTRRTSRVSRPVSVTPANRSVIGFGTAITNFWNKYFDFTGRSTRAEFWFGLLFVFVINWLFAMFVGGIVTKVVGVILFIPMMSLAIRRFRDAGVSVWLYIIPTLLIYVIPLVRGAAWYRMMAVDYISSGMYLFSLFFILDMIFNIVVACLPSKR